MAPSHSRCFSLGKVMLPQSGSPLNEAFWRNAHWIPKFRSKSRSPGEFWVNPQSFPKFHCIPFKFLSPVMVTVRPTADRTDVSISSISTLASNLSHVISGFLTPLNWFHEKTVYFDRVSNLPKCPRVSNDSLKIMDSFLPSSWYWGEVLISMWKALSENPHSFPKIVSMPFKLFFARQGDVAATWQHVDLSFMSKSALDSKVSLKVTESTSPTSRDCMKVCVSLI